MLMEMGKQASALAAFFVLIPALLVCFFGYRMHRVWIALGGAGVGALAAALLTYEVLELGEGISILVSIVGAVLGVVLGYKLYRVGVFVSAAAPILTLGFAADFLLDAGGDIFTAAILVGAVIGLVAAIFVRPVIILSTAIGGGLYCGICTAILLGQWSLGIMLLLWLVFSVAGTVVQWKHPEKKPAKKTVQETEPSVLPGVLAM